MPTALAHKNTLAINHQGLKNPKTTPDNIMAPYAPVVVMPVRSENFMLVVFCMRPHGHQC